MNTEQLKADFEAFSYTVNQRGLVEEKYLIQMHNKLLEIFNAYQEQYVAAKSRDELIGKLVGDFYTIKNWTIYPLEGAAENAAKNFKGIAQHALAEAKEQGYGE